jgi:hypothetical protein
MAEVASREQQAIGPCQAESLAGTLPRQTQLGPVSGRWGQVNLLGERHRAHKRFYQDVTAADYEAGFTRSTMPRVSSGPSR